MLRIYLVLLIVNCVGVCGKVSSNGNREETAHSENLNYLLLTDGKHTQYERMTTMNERRKKKHTEQI